MLKNMGGGGVVVVNVVGILQMGAELRWCEYEDRRKEEGAQPQVLMTPWLQQRVGHMSSCVKKIRLAAMCLWRVFNAIISQKICCDMQLIVCAQVLVSEILLFHLHVTNEHLSAPGPQISTTCSFLPSGPRGGSSGFRKNKTVMFANKSFINRTTVWSSYNILNYNILECKILPFSPPVFTVRRASHVAVWP